ncbi:MAG: hypothetical protein HWN66_02285 [Candidatus Helarchaeota archaeon]|nr:hypothetical protein [Candidatus Helarchaeota archaeon]
MVIRIVIPIGIDIGGSVKVLSGTQKYMIPSMIGAPNPGWSGISPNKEWLENLILIEDEKIFYIGELARLQSELKRLIVKKGRVENLDDVFLIVKAVLSLLDLQEGQELVIATGVPIATSMDLMKQMSAALKGEYNIHIRNDATSEEKKLSFQILKTLVMPEAYGSYYYVVSESEEQVATDAIVVSLDYLTEVLTIYQGRPMRLASGNLMEASLAVLANKIALSLQKASNQIVSPLDLLPNLQQNRNQVNIKGQIYDITESKEYFIREIGFAIADQMKVLIASLPHDAQIEHYIITGEGTKIFWKEIELHLLEEGIIEDIDKVLIPKDPIFTNVMGFENLASKTLIRGSE